MLIKNYIYGWKNSRIVIVIRAKRKPSIDSMPRSGTWVVREWDGDTWQMPAFPEIVWETLKKLTYLGILKAEKSTY